MSLYRANLPSLVVVQATGITSTSNILSGMFDDAVGIIVYAPSTLSHPFHVQVNQDITASTTSSGWATAMSGGQVVSLSAGQTVSFLSGAIGSLRVSSLGAEATGSASRIFNVDKQFQVG